MHYREAMHKHQQPLCRLFGEIANRFCPHGSAIATEWIKSLPPHVFLRPMPARVPLEG